MLSNVISSYIPSHFTDFYIFKDNFFDKTYFNTSEKLFFYYSYFNIYDLRNVNWTTCAILSIILNIFEYYYYLKIESSIKYLKQTK